MFTIVRCITIVYANTMDLKRLRTRLNSCFRNGNKIEALTTITTFVRHNTNNRLPLLIAKTIVENNWIKKGRYGVGRKIVDDLENRGYLTNNNK